VRLSTYHFAKFYVIEAFQLYQEYAAHEFDGLTLRPISTRKMIGRLIGIKFSTTRKSYAISIDIEASIMFKIDINIAEIRATFFFL